MIVRKPIGPLKINNTLYRLSVGKDVPEEVTKYLTDANQLEGLLRSGVIEGEAKITESESKFSRSKRSRVEPVSESESGQ